MQFFNFKICLLALCLVLSACGFKLKQTQSFDESLRSLTIIEKGIDPNFINLLEKNLKQRDVRISPLATVHLNILSYQEQRRAASVDTRNARQTETRITKILKFSLVSKKGKVIIEPSTISQSREYTNDNSNIGGKASEERLLQKSIDKEIVSLLLRRLEGVKVVDQDEALIRAEALEKNKSADPSTKPINSTTP